MSHECENDALKMIYHFLSFQALSIESDSDDDLEDAGGNNLRNDGTLLASDPPKPL